MSTITRRPGSLVNTMRETCRRKNLAASTERTYIQWIRRYVQFHDLQHPDDLSAENVSDYLSHLATNRKVAASTQNQALNAIVFLYKHVLDRDLEEFSSFIRARKPKKLPVVLTATEARMLIGAMSGQTETVASLLYGSGLRIQEAVTLRIKDIDIEYGLLHIHCAKGQKDRKTMLPDRLRDSIRNHLSRVHRIHRVDLKDGYGQVPLPYAFERKSTRAASDWLWQYVFPSIRRSTNYETGEMPRFHISPSTMHKAVKLAARNVKNDHRVDSATGDTA